MYEQDEKKLNKMLRIIALAAAVLFMGSLIAVKYSWTVAGILFAVDVVCGVIMWGMNFILLKSHEQIRKIIL